MAADAVAAIDPHRLALRCVEVIRRYTRTKTKDRKLRPAGGGQA